MNTQHTPGPWEARDYTTAEGDIWIDCASWKHKGRGGLRGGTLATAHRNGAGEGSAEANARLIAAAPELLKALHAMLNAFPICNHKENTAYGIALSAIEKAEGRE